MLGSLQWPLPAMQSENSVHLSLAVLGKRGSASLCRALSQVAVIQEEGATVASICACFHQPNIHTETSEDFAIFLSSI